VPAATHAAPTPTEAPIPDNQGAVTNARAHVPVNDGDKAATNANSTQETIDACPVEVLSVSGVSRVEVTTIGGVEGDHAACAFRASYSPFDTAGKGLSISKWSSATASMKIP
jgi:ferredoxin-like protein FixX